MAYRCDPQEIGVPEPPNNGLVDSNGETTWKHEAISTDRHAWDTRLPYPEAVAVRALGFLGDDRAELKRFLSRTGLSHSDLERPPIDPEHLAATLDFLIGNEPMLLAFTRTVDLPLEAVYEARCLCSYKVLHGAGTGLGRHA